MQTDQRGNRREGVGLEKSQFDLFIRSFPRICTQKPRDHPAPKPLLRQQLSSPENNPAIHG
jgi:hypothetical protein